MANKHIIHDFDRWNSLTVAEREMYLRIGLWDAFNHFAAQLSKEETLTMQTHPEFKELRLQMMACRAGGDKTEDVLKLTDSFEKAVRKLKGT